MPLIRYIQSSYDRLAGDVEEVSQPAAEAMLTTGLVELVDDPLNPNGVRIDVDQGTNPETTQPGRDQDHPVR